jgi:hypothetical protein
MPIISRSFAWGDRPAVRRPRSGVPTELDGGPDAKRSWGDRPAVRRPRSGVPTELDGGPDAKRSWGDRPAVRRPRSGMGPTLSECAGDRGHARLVQKPPSHLGLFVQSPHTQSLGFADVAGQQIPLLGQRRGGRDPSRISRSHLDGSGRGGWFNYRFIRGLNQTTPSARANVASRSLLIAQPPLLLRRGDYASRPVFLQSPVTTRIFHRARQSL